MPKNPPRSPRKRASTRVLRPGDPQPGPIDLARSRQASELVVSLLQDAGFDAYLEETTEWPGFTVLIPPSVPEELLREVFDKATEQIVAQAEGGTQ
jgi:hypothetical protein